jgi:ribosome recycling factor
MSNATRLSRHLLTSRGGAHDPPPKRHAACRSDFVIAILASAGFYCSPHPSFQTMTAEEILFDAEVTMEKSVDYMVHEFSGVRTGKASPALVENVDVEAYGSAMKLKQLALITTPEPRLLVVQPFDAATVKDIEKALKESKIGITPQVDGKIIRLPIPELSEERRKDLVKSLRQMAEEARVRVRANRRTAVDEARKMEKAGELTEDGLRDLESDVQKLTDKSVKEIDQHLERKEAEVMKI